MLLVDGKYAGCGLALAGVSGSITLMSQAKHEPVVSLSKGLSSSGRRGPPRSDWLGALVAKCPGARKTSAQKLVIRSVVGSGPGRHVCLAGTMWSGGFCENIVLD
jgi:hypothetical protein